MATPTCASLRRRDPGRPQTRFRRVQAQLPSPSRRTPACLLRQRLQAPGDIGGSGGVPPAGDGLGNRGAIRARLGCTDREHGGTQDVSPRTGSPREPQSQGPRVLLLFVADASQMSPASEGTPSSLLATSDVGPRTLN